VAKAQEPQPSDVFTLARLRAALLKLTGTDDALPESAAEIAPAESAPAAAPARTDYAVYTREFDEVVRPEQMATPAELSALHAELVAEIERLALTHDGWIRPWAKKIAHRAGERTLLVTLLLDNSGSLRGQQIRPIAAWAALVGDILRHSGVLVEVLGFTTAEWRGGRARQRWVSDGSPERPGRLNDLRYIVYQAHDDDAYCAANFALMLKDGVLKENIDGEALLWAADRQRGIAADEKIIIIMSDGAPVDDSTAAANHPDYLHDHLVEATRLIEGDRQSTLYGIYLEGDYRPFAYYTRSATIRAPEQMGLAVLRFLAGGSGCVSNRGSPHRGG
jgi:cobaltochelatase CobT